MRICSYGHLNPLGFAADLNQVVLRGLLADGASVDVVDEDGSTPLHLAVASENCTIENVERLLAYGTDVNAVDDSGGTVLEIVASKRSREEIAELLLAHGADPNHF